MHVNTESYQEMRASICNVLNINDKDIDILFESCYNKYQKDCPVFILDNQYDYFMEYIKEHLSKDIDKVLFFHLARRLDNIDDNGYDLVDMLIKDTSLSRFLMGYGLMFKYDRYIKIFKDGQEIDLNKFDNYSYNHLKYRFGYNHNNFSIKGYAFNDELENNSDYEIAQSGPEFLSCLYPFVEDDLVDEFIENSKFYKFEYLVPIEIIEFENYEELNNDEKKYHIVVKALQHLYAYKYDKFDFNNNITLGIKDNQILESKYLISKNEI